MDMLSLRILMCLLLSCVEKVWIARSTAMSLYALECRFDHLPDHWPMVERPGIVAPQPT